MGKPKVVSFDINKMLEMFLQRVRVNLIISKPNSVNNLVKYLDNKI